MRPVGERGKHRGTIKDGPGGSKGPWARLPKLVIARIARILKPFNSNSGNFRNLRRFLPISASQSSYNLMRNCVGPRRDLLRCLVLNRMWDVDGIKTGAA